MLIISIATKLLPKWFRVEALQEWQLENPFEDISYQIRQEILEQ